MHLHVCSRTKHVFRGNHYRRAYAEILIRYVYILDVAIPCRKNPYPMPLYLAIWLLQLIWSFLCFWLRKYVWLSGMHAYKIPTVVASNIRYTKEHVFSCVPIKYICNTVKFLLVKYKKILVFTVSLERRQDWGQHIEMVVKLSHLMLLSHIYQMPYQEQIISHVILITLICAIVVHSKFSLDTQADTRFQIKWVKMSFWQIKINFSCHLLLFIKYYRGWTSIDNEHIT